MAAAAVKQIQVVIVEDEELYRDLLAKSLTQCPHISVIGGFADGETALEAVQRLHPDVLILDIQLPGAMNGIQLGLLLRNRFPRLGIILLSNYGDLALLSAIPRDALAGWSYLSKRSVTDLGALQRAIDASAAGFVVMDARVIAQYRPPDEKALAQLTPRQRSILVLIAEGLTNEAIAERLKLSTKTVKNQISALYQTLDINADDRAVHPRVKAALTFLQENRESVRSVQEERREASTKPHNALPNGCVRLESIDAQQVFCTHVCRVWDQGAHTLEVIMPQELGGERAAIQIGQEVALLDDDLGRCAAVVREVRVKRRPEGDVTLLALEKGARLAHPPKRRFFRAPVELPVRSAGVEGKVINLSGNGALIHWNAPLPNASGASLELRLRVRSLKAPLVVRAQPIRRGPQTRADVAAYQFVELSEKARYRIVDQVLAVP